MLERDLEQHLVQVVRVEAGAIRGQIVGEEGEHVAALFEHLDARGERTRRVVLHHAVAVAEVGAAPQGRLDLALLRARGRQPVAQAAHLLAAFVAVLRADACDRALHVEESGRPVAARHRLFGALREPIARRARLFELEAQRLDGVEQLAARPVWPVDERLEDAEGVEPRECRLQRPHGHGHRAELPAGVADDLPRDVGHVAQRAGEHVGGQAAAHVQVRELLDEVDQGDVQAAQAEGCCRCRCSGGAARRGALADEVGEMLQRRFVPQLRQPFDVGLGGRDAIEVERQAVRLVAPVHDRRRGAAVGGGHRVDRAAGSG
ncbi:MAG: hypothetical protein U1E73_07900 [Planctomycetota bacterium]